MKPDHDEDQGVNPSSNPDFDSVLSRRTVLKGGLSGMAAAFLLDPAALLADVWQPSALGFERV